MNTQLPTFLPKKYQQPKNRIDTLERTRLYEDLNDVRTHGWISLVAPSGFGKSTLVSSWLEKQDCKVAWISLDESDNSSVKFWTSIAVGLSQNSISSSVIKELLSGGAEEAGSIDWVNQLFTELSAKIINPSDEIVIVLDDLHHVTNNAIYTALCRLLRLLPKGICFVFLSRKPLSKHVATLNGGDAGKQLSASELSMDEDEISEILKQTSASRNASIKYHNVSSQHRDIAAFVHAKTDGWPIFVSQTIDLWNDLYPLDKLLVESTINKECFSDLIETNVVNHLEESTLSTLVALSQLPVIDDTLYQFYKHPSLSFLDLMKSTQFFEECPTRPGFYKLKAPLKCYFKKCWAADVPLSQVSLFEAILGSFLGREMYVEAISFCLEFRYCQRAISLIESKYEVILASGRWAEINDWFQFIPESIINDRPVVCAFLAWNYLYQCNIPKSEQYIKLTSSSLLTAGMNYCEKFVYRSKSELEGDLINIQHWLTEVYGAEETLSLEFIKQSNPVCHSTTLGYELFDGLALINRGDLKAAQRVLEGVSKRAVSEDNRAVLFKSLSALGWVCYLTGDFDRLFHLVSAVKQTLSSSSLAYIDISNAALGMAYLERGEPVKAEKILQDVSRQLELNAPIDVRYCILMMRVLAKIETANFTNSDAIFFELETIAINLPASVLNTFYSITALKADLYLKQSRVNEAGFWAEELPTQISSSFGVRDFHERLVKIDVMMSSGHLSEALREMQIIRDDLEHSGNQILLLRSYISESLIYFARNNDEKSLETINHAILIGKKTGCVNPFQRDQYSMAALLEKAKKITRFPSYLGQILVKVNAATENESVVETCKLSSLSKREREVLELMATGISNPEIAETLCRSLGTVKIHVHNIYRKLGASNRVTAINKFVSASAS